MDQDLDIQQLQALQGKAVDAAKAAAVPIQAYFDRVDLHVLTKTDGSPVTQADKEAELLIRERLLQGPEFGSWDILGEEQGLKGQGTRWRWVVDPIDGTRSFIHGIPLFGTLISLFDTHMDIPLIGVIHLPLLGLTYSAAKGLGATCQGQALQLSSPSSSDDTKVMIGVGDVAQFIDAKREQNLDHLQKVFPYTRGYTDCFGHSLVLRGSLGAMLDPALNPWDILATQVLIEEAGGLILLRPSHVAQKVDALFGCPPVVEKIAKELNF